MNIDLEYNKKEISNQIFKLCNNDKTIINILFNRGFDDFDKISDFFDVDKEFEYNELANISEGVKRIKKAIESDEKILIYGDYDVDGITSTSSLYLTLKKLNSNVFFHIPDRFTEGYGINKNVIVNKSKEDIDLIITCDCGISNTEEVEIAKNLGMDVIITDHHNIPEILPNADVIINPKFLPKDHKAYMICGCATAYYLCKALLDEFGESKYHKELLDFVVLATIADVVPLKGLNRELLIKNLQNIYTSEKPGIKSLIEVSGGLNTIKTEEDIAFQLTPRLNATGRIRSGSLGVELLTEFDFSKAIKMAVEINETNVYRKQLQNDIIKEAEQLAKKNNKKIIVLYKPTWHHGVIGIAAGKVCEKYNKPTILLSYNEEKGNVVGSCRSTDSINIYELLKKASKFLNKFGGHSAAAGLSLEKENIELFRKHIEFISDETIKKNIDKKYKIDEKLDLDNINMEFYKKLRSLAPYGEGFSKPLFYTENCLVVEEKIIKKQHHFFKVIQGETKMEASLFGYGDEELINNVINIVYTISERTYEGNRKLVLNVEAFVKGNKSKPEKEKRNVKIIDKRKTKIKDNINVAKEYLVYSKGSLKKEINKNVSNKTKGVLLTIPFNKKEIISFILSNNLQELIISFEDEVNYKLTDIIKNLISILKKFINNQVFEIDFSLIIQLLGVDEVFVEKLFDLLKYKGFIDYYIEQNTIMISKTKNKHNERMVKVIYEDIKDKYNELMGWKNSFRKSTIEEIKQFLE